MAEVQYKAITGELTGNAEEIDLERKEMMSGARSDPNFPLNDKTHPLYDNYFQHWTKLNKAHSESRPDPYQKILDEHEAEKNRKQAELNQQAQREINELVKHGVYREMPEKVTKTDVAILRIQNARRTNKKSFVQLMDNALFRCNNIPSEQLEAYWQYKRGAQDADNVKYQLSALTNFVYKQLKAKDIW